MSFEDCKQLVGQKTVFRSLALEFSLRSDHRADTTHHLSQSMKLVTHQCPRVLTPARAFMSVPLCRGALKIFYKASCWVGGIDANILCQSSESFMTWGSTVAYSHLLFWSHSRSTTVGVANLMYMPTDALGRHP